MKMALECSVLTKLACCRRRLTEKDKPCSEQYNAGSVVSVLVKVTHLSIVHSLILSKGMNKREMEWVMK